MAILLWTPARGDLTIGESPVKSRKPKLLSEEYKIQKTGTPKKDWTWVTYARRFDEEEAKALARSMRAEGGAVRVLRETVELIY